ATPPPEPALPPKPAEPSVPAEAAAPDHTEKPRVMATVVDHETFINAIGDALKGIRPPARQYLDTSEGDVHFSAVIVPFSDEAPPSVSFFAWVPSPLPEGNLHPFTVIYASHLMWPAGALQAGFKESRWLEYLWPENMEVNPVPNSFSRLTVFITARHL